MSRWSKFRQFSWAERKLQFKALFVVLYLLVALRVTSFKRVLAIVSRKNLHASTKHNAHSATTETQADIVRAVRAVARLILRDKPCLPQALAVKWLLGARGKDARLQIGVVKKKGNKLDAHAWLELDDEIIIGGRTSPARFKQLQPVD